MKFIKIILNLFKIRKDKSILNNNVIKQWDDIIQKHLLYYQKTGELSKNMFIFD